MNPSLLSRRIASACLVVAGAASCDAPPEATVPPSTASEAAAPDEVRIALFMDSAKNATVFKVGTQIAGSEAELERLLQEAAEARARSSKPACPVVIDAVRTVPWRDVVAAINACKKAGLAKVEFAFSEG